MLTQDSLSAAFPLAQKLAEKGVVLTPVPNTPLETIVNASLVHIQAAQGSPAAMETLGDFQTALLEGSVYKDPNGLVAHDDVMAAAVAAASQAVVFNLDLARNKVNPIVQAVMAQAQGAMDQNAQAALAPLAIEPFYYQPIWNNALLGDMVARHQNTVICDTKLQSLNIPRPVSYLEAMATGATGFDAEIAEFCNTVGEDYVAGIWARTFGPQADFNLLDVLRGNYEKANAGLIVYLMARRYQEDVPEGVNMELSAWKAYISTIMAQGGRDVVRTLSKRERDMAMQTLVIDSPGPDSPKGLIRVNGDVYDNWIREGGTPEVLMGACFADGQRGYRALLEKSEYYNKTWTRNRALLETQLSFERFGALVNGLRAAMASQINAMPDDMLVTDRAILHERLRKHIGYVRQVDLECLWKVSRRLVCRVMFPHTDAEAVLIAIDKSSQEHPELDIREAALLATVDYVTAWVCKLFTVESSAGM